METTGISSDGLHHLYMVAMQFTFFLCILHTHFGGKVNHAILVAFSKHESFYQLPFCCEVFARVVAKLTSMALFFSLFNFHTCWV